MRHAIGFGLLLTAAALISALGLALGGTGKRTLVRGVAEERWPAETLQDWVGFADHVAWVTVLAEQRLSTDPAVLASGTGRVERIVDVRVESIVWSRGLASALPERLTLAVDGWWQEGGEIVPFASLGWHRPAVGESLLVPLLLTTDLGWALLDSPLPVVAGRVEPGPGVGEPADDLAGLTLVKAGERLGATRPSDVALAKQALDPDVRAQAVFDDREAGGGG
ncbi:MAG: hypothetical protein ACKVUT_16310 [Gaiella sp.]